MSPEKSHKERAPRERRPRERSERARESQKTQERISDLSIPESQLTPFESSQRGIAQYHRLAEQKRPKKEKVVTIRHARGREGKFKRLSKSEKQTMAILDAEIGKLKTESMESAQSRTPGEKFTDNAAHERNAFEKYAKQSLSPSVTDKERASLAKIAAAEASHVVANVKLSDDRADNTPQN